MEPKENGKVCNIIPMTVKNYRQMMVINKTVLPVSYSDDFYQGVIEDKNVLPFCKYGIPPFLSRLKYSSLSLSRALSFVLLPVCLASLAFPAIFDMDLVVGGVMCRREQKADGKAAHYIMTIGVLRPYEHLGIGSALLHEVIESAKRDESCDEVYLHVWVDNKAAFDFYTKKNGFIKKATIENYYHDLEHPHAHVLSFPIVHE